MIYAQAPLSQELLDNLIVVKDLNGDNTKKTEELNESFEILIKSGQISDTAKKLDGIMDAFHGPERHLLKKVLKKRSVTEFLRESNMGKRDVNAKTSYVRSQLDWFREIGEKVDIAASRIEEHKKKLRRFLGSCK
jgi:hypothetical protein